jgi:hypothetical protein
MGRARSVDRLIYLWKIEEGLPWNAKLALA